MGAGFWVVVWMLVITLVALIGLINGGRRGATGDTGYIGATGPQGIRGPGPTNAQVEEAVKKFLLTGQARAVVTIEPEPEHDGWYGSDHFNLSPAMPKVTFENVYFAKPGSPETHREEDCPLCRQVESWYGWADSK